MAIDPEELPFPRPLADSDPRPEPGSGFRIEPPFAPGFRLRPRSARHIPNLAHALLFIIITAAVLFFVETAGLTIAATLHFFGQETAQQMIREPRLLIPTMALSYVLAAALGWTIFSSLWHAPFLRGVRWNATGAGHRFYAFIILGVIVSVAVQVLSNYLPIPKTLPIDNYFRTSTDVWLVALFGTFLAPAFEELVFRGFLFPAFASAWDWVVRPSSRREEHEPGKDPVWSRGAIVFSTALTSAGFAMLHSGQLAHSWAPLAVLFSVSIVLCMVRLKSHSTAASALVHASYNATIFVLLYVATDGYRHLDKLTR